MIPVDVGSVKVVIGAWSLAFERPFDQGGLCSVLAACPPAGPLPPAGRTRDDHRHEFASCHEQ